MDTVLHIWNTLVKSNTFNFIVMLFILACAVKKFAIKENMENARVEVVNSIEKSKQEKSLAEQELFKTEKSVENLQTELDERLDNAKKQALDLEKNVLDLAAKKVEQIENSVQNIILAEEKQISAKLTSDTAGKSSQLAKQKIIAMLEANPAMHEKFIDECIAELDRIDL